MKNYVRNDIIQNATNFVAFENKFSEAQFSDVILGGNMFNKKEKMCRNCIFAKYYMADFIGGCGYICHINPFKPVAMGLLGSCSKRKQCKQEQYPKKKKDS